MVLLAVLAALAWGACRFGPAELDTMTVCRPNLFMMRFFRDLSRAKARRRLHRNDAALITLMLGNEEPMGPKTVRDDDTDGFTLTAAELADMNGQGDPPSPLYLSIKGRIYDVTAGQKFYGVGRSYYKFIGRDGSRGFATGCHDEPCLIASLVGLSDAELREPPLSKRDAKKQAKGQAKLATLGGGSDHQQWIEQAARQGLLNQAAGIKCTKRQKKAVKWLPKLGAPRMAALKSAIGKEAAERRANAQATRQLAGAKELLKAHNRGEAAPVSGKKLKKAKALVASQHTCPSCGLGFKKLKQLQKHAANSRAGHNQCGQQVRFPRCHTVLVYG